MTVSVLDLFSIGIGPSSSHTVGPMRAAQRFAGALEDRGAVESTARVLVELFGSLGSTGAGHGSDKAAILGLMGADPQHVDTDTADEHVSHACQVRCLSLGGRHEIDFDRARDVRLYLDRTLPEHPNGMTFTAFDAGGETLLRQTFYSIGGGFVVAEAEMGRADTGVAVPFPFDSAAQLMACCARHEMRVSDVVLANEGAFREEARTRAELLNVWAVMRKCVENGCRRSPTFLPGPLRVQRRAPRLLAELESKNAPQSQTDPLSALDWVALWALAVNEENASGGRVVTAPTNGAAGIIPAVLHYYCRFVPGTDDEGVVRFLLTAGAIAMLIKRNASISGAEVGCQGEVGSACAMAAGALCEVLGGTPSQVENAAEIGIEHNLGLTCDPVGGLVQIPCIERNAVASVKAINAARLSLHGDGSHRVSLDAAIATMRQTGADMRGNYKETSLGGLAINVVAC